MAEVAAIVGLVASITSLVDLSAKVVSRLYEFTSETSKIPESFRSLSIRLPLLTVTLQCIQKQAEASRLPDDVAKALKAVIDNTSEQVSAVQICLSRILPPSGVFKLERALMALKSVAQEDKIQRALEKIHKNNDILVLHQSTRHVDAGDRILGELSKLGVALPAPSKSIGVCLGRAPQIASDAFIGRAHELQQLRDWLSPKTCPHHQRIVSIVGMGGMGKTQLSLAHVRDCIDNYSSVLWVNAKDETSLRQSIAEISPLIIHRSPSLLVHSADDEKLKINQVQRWLSDPGNDQWLLIFDNYDDPNLPGVRSPTGYDIRSFFPMRSQGSILITSRSTKLAFSKQLKLRNLDDRKATAGILSQRSGRDLSIDSDAVRLAERLGGLPLALATAGAFLGSTGISCGEYLEAYESAWMDLVGSDAEELLEYETRTMASTWAISLKQVRSQNEDAAELLMFLAYLSNHDIWYDLIKAGVTDELPWMRRVTESKIHFQRIMSKLQAFSLVDVVAGSYQVHPCLHDWLVECLNTPPDFRMFVAALMCVGDSIDHHWNPSSCMANGRLLEHTEQLESLWSRNVWELSASEEKICAAVHNVAKLQREWDRLDAAELMYDRALVGREKILGPDHISTLKTLNSLGLLYRNQGKLGAAEKTFLQVIARKERALGPTHPSTLVTINNLGRLYRDQSKVDAAEHLFIRALAGRENALGPDHTSTLSTVNNLGLLYHDQGKLKIAESTLLRALVGKEKVCGPDHISTLNTVNNLGLLYRDQGKLDAAEETLIRALAGREKAYGSDHTSTLATVDNLGLLYADQGNLDAAEKMYERALAGREKVLGPSHISTIQTVRHLGNIYRDQGKPDAAEQMYDRAQGM